MEIDFSPTEELEFGLSRTTSPDIDFGTGGVQGTIDIVKVNGQPLPIVNRSVDVPVPTKTSQLQNDGSDGTSTYVEADDLATVATTGDYNDLNNKPSNGMVLQLTVDADYNFTWSGAANIATIKTAFDAGSSITVAIDPNLSLYGNAYKIIGAEWDDETDRDKLEIALFDQDSFGFILLTIQDDFSAIINSKELQERLEAGNGISISGTTISATNSVTVDSTLSSFSPNPVQNQALYNAIVGTEVSKMAYTSGWEEPYASDGYNTHIILTLPDNTFTDDSLIELVNYTNYQTFAKHGFVIFGVEASTQRVWIASMGVPENNVNFSFRIYNYGS